MKKYALIELFLFAALVVLVPSLTSCKKAEEPRESESKEVFNPYTADTVFDKVKREVDANPGDVDALMHLADLYERNAQYAQAIETYKKVVELRPEMGYAYLKLGTAYSRSDQPAEAVEAFKNAVKYMPDYAVPYNNMGVAYGKLGKYDEEISALNKAIELRPQYSSARFNLGVTYMKKGNREEAMKQYTLLKEFDEGAAEALLKEIRSSS
jgi:tetratricopeptide (TPR) repeat protein